MTNERAKEEIYPHRKGTGRFCRPADTGKETDR